MNNFVVQDLGTGDIFSHRSSGDCEAIKVQNTEFGDFIHHGADAARFVKLFNVVVAGRCQVAKIGCLLADFVGNRQVQINAAFMGDGGQVQHGVSRAAQSHVDGQGV